MASGVIKKSGITAFTLGKYSSTETDFTGNGFYDESTNTVTIYLSTRPSSSMTTAIMAYVPQAYRPSSTKYGIGIINNYPTGSVFVTSSGEIKQGASSSFSSGFCVIEYVLE